uniref:Uncharacterized protein n=1 Tax=Amorphochlora amoebiformis TaxID=1561963 RepID=A0A0H5BI12_9EUKA|nr:hypothetical protein [Amorphochlora amoebiformis]
MKISYTTIKNHYFAFTNSYNNRMKILLTYFLKIYYEKKDQKNNFSFYFSYIIFNILQKHRNNSVLKDHYDFLHNHSLSSYNFTTINFRQIPVLLQLFINRLFKYILKENIIEVLSKIDSIKLMNLIFEIYDLKIWKLFTDINHDPDILAKIKIFNFEVFKNRFFLKKQGKIIETVRDSDTMICKEGYKWVQKYLAALFFLNKTNSIIPSILAYKRILLKKYFHFYTLCASSQGLQISLAHLLNYYFPRKKVDYSFFLNLFHQKSYFSLERTIQCIIEIILCYL